MVGNLKNYTKIDILRCLLRMDNPISRSNLSKTLDLGEGTIRSILDILKENDLSESNKEGHYLSSKGDKIMQKIKNGINVKEIDFANLFPKQKKAAIQVRHPENIKKSHILRDLAVKNGADGAILLKYDKHNKKLKIFDVDYEEDLSEIESKFSLNHEDLLIITYANSYKLAEHGALAVAIELNTGLKQLMNKFKYYLQ